LFVDDSKKGFYSTLIKAKMGNAEAQCNIAEMYYKSLGVPQNLDESIKWYVKAAEQGNAEAQFRLGIIYAIGEGTPQNAIQAYKWFNLAAAQGNKKAIKGRELLTQGMSSEQIAEGQRLGSSVSYPSNKNRLPYPIPCPEAK